MAEPETLSAEWETLRYGKGRMLDLRVSSNDGGLFTHRTLVPDA
jgi:hypothetical protein